MSDEDQVETPNSSVTDAPKGVAPAQKQKPKRPQPRSWLTAPFLWIEWLMEWIAYWAGRLAVFQVLEYAGKLSILIVLLLWLKDCDLRTEESHRQAWLVVNSALEQGGSGGRIQALEYLNRESVSLRGLSAPKANLQEIRLPRAQLSRADLTGADLGGADLSDANLFKAILSEANLYQAILIDATLIEADLTSATLSGANLIRANLFRANLFRANLLGADLSDANLGKANLTRAQRPEDDLQGFGWRADEENRLHLMEDQGWEWFTDGDGRRFPSKSIAPD